MIDRQTARRPPSIYGFSFPHIDPGDPKAGIKVMWNTSSTTYKFRRLWTPFEINWVGRNGFERRVGGQVYFATRTLRIGDQLLRTPRWMSEPLRTADRRRP